jgi:hypothetical protein
MLKRRASTLIRRLRRHLLPGPGEGRAAPPNRRTSLFLSPPLSSRCKTPPSLFTSGPDRDRRDFGKSGRRRRFLAGRGGDGASGKVLPEAQASRGMSHRWDSGRHDPEERETAFRIRSCREGSRSRQMAPKPRRQKSGRVGRR